MGQAGGVARLELESADELGVLRVFGPEDLDCHVPLQPPIAGAPDDRHPAASDRHDELVALGEDIPR
jgi:hypothetical protein